MKRRHNKLTTPFVENNRETIAMLLLRKEKRKPKVSFVYPLPTSVASISRLIPLKVCQQKSNNKINKLKMTNPSVKTLVVAAACLCSIVLVIGSVSGNQQQLVEPQELLSSLKNLQPPQAASSLYSGAPEDESLLRSPIASEYLSSLEDSSSLISAEDRAAAAVSGDDLDDVNGAGARRVFSSSSTSLAHSRQSIGAMQQQQPKTVVLLDTTQQSSLGWLRYPDASSASNQQNSNRAPGWVEESYQNFERAINWRSFVVCDVAFASINNWLWTPFIERHNANRLYIEIKFQMRDCSLFPGHAVSCKETFTLLYKETDTPLVSSSSSATATATATATASTNNASLAAASSDTYKLIDAIAADAGRSTSANDVVPNTETRSVPVTAKGVYFAFRDQGACLSLISIKVYYVMCPAITLNFATFNATPTGAHPTSVDLVDGQCVPGAVNSHANQQQPPRMFCKSDGTWMSLLANPSAAPHLGLSDAGVPLATGCRCAAGYEPNGARCSPCAPGKFKPAIGEGACRACPEHSYVASTSKDGAAVECKCRDGYYRARQDSRSSACTKPPSSPTNLTIAHVDSNSVALEWSAPLDWGNRQDLVYKLQCDNCDSAPSLVSSPTYLSNFTETRAVLAGLSPGTSYTLVVFATNGVSQYANYAPAYAELRVQTLLRVAPTLSSSQHQQANKAPIFNFVALTGARATDMVLAWDAMPSSSAAAAALGASSSDSLEALLPSHYELRFAARNSLSSSTPNYQASSPYSSMLLPAHSADFASSLPISQPQSVTTINRALALTNLLPRTEFAFQIRAKYAHAHGWSDYSEPIYKTTGNVMAASYAPTSTSFSPANTNNNYNDEYPSEPSAEQAATSSLLLPMRHHHDSMISLNSNLVAQGRPAASAGSWLSTVALMLAALIGSLALVFGALFRYRNSLFVRRMGGSRATGFGSLGSTYCAVYGGTSGGTASLADHQHFGASLPPQHHLHYPQHPHSNNASHLLQQQQQRQPTTLIAHHHLINSSSNATSSRSSSSGSASGQHANHQAPSTPTSNKNLVTNFFAATMGQLSERMGGYVSSGSSGNGTCAGKLNTSQGKQQLFASQTQHLLANNNYSTRSSTTLVPGPTTLLRPQQAITNYINNNASFSYVPNTAASHYSQAANNYATSAASTVNAFGQQHQQHIYDDLDQVTSPVVSHFSHQHITQQPHFRHAPNQASQVRVRRVDEERVIVEQLVCSAQQGYVSQNSDASAAARCNTTHSPSTISNSVHDEQPRDL